VTIALMWFRRDLRTHDLPALRQAAIAGKGRVVPLFVVDPLLLARSGPNRRRFLAGALAALDTELAGGLVVRRGDPVEVVPAVAEEVGADTVAVTADFAPYGAQRDQLVAARLAAEGRRLLPAGSNYLLSPGTVRTAQGRPYQVFSAFHRAWQRQRNDVAPQSVPLFEAVELESDLAPDKLVAAPVARPGDGLPTWWEGLPLEASPSHSPAGPTEAWRRLERFIDQGRIERYAEDRDIPGVAGTTGLSPYLRFGCVHPRSVLSVLPPGPGAQRLEAELCWREFFADVLWHQPYSARANLQGWANRLVWETGPVAQQRFFAWATGRTGFPFVDAGMRQLLTEGWMHNRARMMVASFLVKDLHLDWRWGARWFMWHLADADLASNQHGWQWVAGTGTDAAPFHRIMSPDRQQERFDAEGAYTKSYLSVPDRVGPGPPVVDHAVERVEALRRHARARRG
jgi:deoxyribodipyrimidine photo-lyase